MSSIFFVVSEKKKIQKKNTKNQKNAKDEETNHGRGISLDQQ
jgi:hypothetical protein